MSKANTHDESQFSEEKAEENTAAERDKFVRESMDEPPYGPHSANNAGDADGATTDFKNNSQQDAGQMGQESVQHHQSSDSTYVPPTYVSTSPYMYMRNQQQVRVVQPTGLSVPTLAFGIFLAVAGFSCMLIGVFLSWHDYFGGLNVQLGMMLKIVTGIIGGLLLLAGCVWGIVSLIRGRADKNNEHGAEPTDFQ